MTPTQYMRLFRARRIAQGLCGDCGDRPFVNGYTRCEPCRHTQRVSAAALRLRRKASKLCLRCGAPARGPYCDPHREERNEMERKTRAARGGV